MYTITKSDENDSEKQEVIKVARFYEFVHDKKVIGMPARKLKERDLKHFQQEVQMVERWPMIQAYGLDIIGGGFFTMKHAFRNMRDELDQIYMEYDSFSKYRIVNEEIERLNVHYFDNFFNFNKDTIAKRV
jgi:hypothetical protein